MSGTAAALAVFVILFVVVSTLFGFLIYEHHKLKNSINPPTKTGTSMMGGILAN